jgi:DNA-binding FadR family transcriptional regulator
MCRISPEELVDEIYRCFIFDQTAGHSLPSEHMLAEYFGVSRLKIREALKILIGKSLVTSSKGKRSQIANEHSNLLNYIVTTGAASNPNWYADLCHVRMALESEAASLAASEYRMLDLEQPKIALFNMKQISFEIEDLRKKEENVSELVRKYNEADLNFHRTLVESCHNNTISLFYSSLSNLMQQSFQLTQNIVLNPSKNFCNNFELHNQIFESIRCGYSSEAEKIIRDHMTKVHLELKSAVSASLIINQNI